MNQNQQQGSKNQPQGIQMQIAPEAIIGVLRDKEVRLTDLEIIIKQQILVLQEQEKINRAQADEIARLKAKYEPGEPEGNKEKGN